MLLLLTAVVTDACAQETQINPALSPIRMTQHDTWTSNLPLKATQLVIVAWVFVLGSCFGSFLNVVIYRLPAGMSLGKPKSRCPRCETQLAIKDNVPVFGWLWLRGRCRYCQLPIPARYPIVEAVCGILFVVLLFGELLTGAANLPVRHPDHFHVHPGFWLVWFMKWDLTGIYLYHCCLLVVVLAVVMIGYDGHRPQARLAVFGVMVGLLVAVFNSDLRPLPAFAYPDSILAMKAGFWWHAPFSGGNSRIYTGIAAKGGLDGLFGVAAGFVAGWLVSWQMGFAKLQLAQARSVEAIGSAFIITGAFLGWQACGMLCLLFLPLSAVCRLIEKSPMENAVAIPVTPRLSDTPKSSDSSAPAEVSDATMTSELGVQQQLVRILAPGYFVMLLTFLLCWRWLDDAPWMIGHAGWSFLGFEWWLEWLATLLVMLMSAHAVRIVVSRQRNIAVDELQHPGGNTV